MIDFRYIVCPVCRCISRLTSDEEEKCVYCDANIRGGKEVSERQWRKYWIGVVGQYKSGNNAKVTKQLDLERASGSAISQLKEENR